MNTIYKVINFVAVLILETGISGLYAQEAITASGGESSGMYGSISYSVGQVVYTTNTGITGSVTQGVQQPFEVSVILGTDELADIDLMVAAYPNPAADYLILKVDNADSQYFRFLSYQLFDIRGKLLENKKLTESVTSISMKDLASASYFLRITDNKKGVKVFKIIKN